MSTFVKPGRISALACVIAALLLGSAAAQEGSHYTPGVFNIQDFAAPAPGVYFQNFLVVYRTDRFNDRNGKRVDFVDVNGQAVPIDIDVDAVTNFPAVYFITDKRFLGADFGMVIGVPIQNTDISAALPTLGIGAEASNFGLGDIMVQPVMLGWHPDRWDFMANYIFYAPTGEYEEGAPDNLGLGYWTHEVQAAAVYRGGANRLWTFAGMATYDFHTSKRGFDLTPGHTFTVDWGLSKILAPSLIELGLTGYSQWQVSDDSGFDVTRDPNIHDQVHALGGQFSWTTKSQKLNLALRYLVEFEAKDRFQGHLGVFTISYGF